jgi:phage shock protein E
MAIIDVRSREEFESNHIEGAINIPLQVISDSLEEIRSLSGKPIILYCATGTKSGMATNFLKIMGVNCENGGSMENLTSKLKK